MLCAPPPTLPTYTQDEVKVFHPYLQTALECAIHELGETDLEILHHQSIGRITADFIIRRRSTRRYVLFIEVKRQRGSVSSMPNRLQAQNYVTEALAHGPALVEKPYYVLTNVELSEVFKYTSHNPSVDQQVLSISPLSAGSFRDAPASFFRNLVDNYKIIIRTSLDDSGVYKPTTSRLDHLLRVRQGNLSEWHQALVVTGYEYIRGALSPTGWREATIFQHDPNRLLAIGNNLDFRRLFSTPAPSSTDRDLWQPQLLAELHRNGAISKTGQDVAQIAYMLIAEGRSQEGLVPTDIELAQLLAALVRYACGRELEAGEKFCDPAAGTGSLLASLPTAFTRIQPSQIWANELESRMIEPLSVLLGLHYSTSLSPSNAPEVTTQDILTLTTSDFSDVKVIVMNPPFRSGITSIDEKERFAHYIRRISGRSSILNIGQAGLEALFLEFVVNLVSDGTILGIVFPKQILTATGLEAQKVRSYLLNEFGLKIVATYPNDNLFESVTKATCLLIGQKGSPSEEVISIEINIPLTQISPIDLSQNLSHPAPSGSLGYGGIYHREPIGELRAKVKTGWRLLSSTSSISEKWLNEHIKPLSTNLDSQYNTRRGRLGNAGASDLIFPDSNATIWSELQPLVPDEWLMPALRTVDEIEDIIINPSSVGSHALCAPASAYIAGGMGHSIMIKIIETYHNNMKVDTGLQRRKTKSPIQLLRIVKSEAEKPTNSNTVLIPRNIRRHARAFITNTTLYVSTNVIEVSGGSSEEQLLLVSWILTIFAQLHFEVLAKDQEGARKLEEVPIQALFVPVLNQLSEEDKQHVLNALRATTSFNDLYSPGITALDRAWAEVLFPGQADFVLQEALDLLKDLVRERNPN